MSTAPTSPRDALGSRAFVLARRFTSAHTRALTVGLIIGSVLAGIAVLVLAGAPWPLRVVAQSVILTVGAWIGWTLALPTRIRVAWETFAWVGRWDIDRFERVTGTRVPTSPDEMEAWLAGNVGLGPERLARVEILGSIGRLDEARTLLTEAPPTDDPWDRFERRLMGDWLEWVATGSNDQASVRAAAEPLGRGTSERRRADAMLAINEARALADRDDREWTLPLERIRPHLGDEPTEVLRRDTVRPMLRTILVVALVGSLVLELAYRL